MDEASGLPGNLRAEDVSEMRVKPGNEFHRNIEKVHTVADQLCIKKTGGMKMG